MRNPNNEIAANHPNPLPEEMLKPFNTEMRNPNNKMAANPPNPLPEEMLIEIFSRLPTKSVGRFRCLSKFWRSQLSNSHFLNLHFTQKPRQENLILITSDNDETIVQTISLPVTDDAAVLKKLDLPKIVHFWGSCNGLVLLRDNKNDLFLVNPVTKEQKTIPACPYDKKLRRSIEMKGFGYDSLSDDYKIVSIRSWFTTGIEAFVYSVKKGLWVRHFKFPRLLCCSLDTGVLLNGALHWSAYDIERRPVILVFDLASEEFNVIPTPSYAQLPKFCQSFTLGGCLGNAELPMGDKDVLQGWIMKVYGSRESWVGIGVIRALCYVGEDDVLLLNTMSQKLFVYNVKEQTKRQMLVDRGVDVVTDGILFVDSLVSPHRIAISS